MTGLVIANGCVGSITIELIRGDLVRRRHPIPRVNPSFALSGLSCLRQHILSLQVLILGFPGRRLLSRRAGIVFDDLVLEML